MDRAAIAALLLPVVQLSGEQLEQTSMYIDILLQWNARINLTAIDDEEQIVVRHFGESFFAARHLLSPDARAHLIDVGSGAGFPGLPMAIYARETRVTLIESNLKKAAFLSEVIDRLKLNHASVFAGRGEAFSGAGDVVTMRAVEKFEKVLPAAAKLVGNGGRLGLMIGASQLEKARAIATGFAWSEPLEVPGSVSRVLAVGIKPVIVE